MIGGIFEKYCPICQENTEHLLGCFKSQKIGDELFHLDVSVSESVKKLSNGFRNFVLKEQGGVMDGDRPEEFAETVGGGQNFEELFASTVRSLKCSECGHLIQIGRLP